LKKSLKTLLVTALISSALALPASAYGTTGSGAGGTTGTGGGNMTDNTTGNYSTRGNYTTNNVRANAADRNDGVDWGWLGLLGLLGLAGMRRKETDRR